MGNKIQIGVLERRLKIWQDLMDTSSYLALAGLKFKGYSKEESRDRLRKLWIKTSQEHKQANLEIVKRLYARTNNDK